jgi:hypothetical protein
LPPTLPTMLSQAVGILFSCSSEFRGAGQGAVRTGLLRREDEGRKENVRWPLVIKQQKRACQLTGRNSSSIQACDEDAGAYTFRATSPSKSSPAQFDRKESAEKQDRTSQKDLVAETEKELTALSIDEPKPRQRDPLRWFGILVPPALRSAQSSFVSAAEDSVPSLATVMAEMRNVEGEVGRVRSKIESLE